MKLPLEDLTSFASYCAGALEEAGNEQAIIMTEDGEGVLCLTLAYDEDSNYEPDPHQVLAMLRGRSFAGMATRTRWSPDERDPADAWTLIVVGSDLPADYYVMRLDDNVWYHPDFVSTAPWFVASTAAALRGFLAGRESPFRVAQDRVLMQTMSLDGPQPKVHLDGRI